MTRTATRPGPPNPIWVPNLFKYRVMLGEKIIGQFSNMKLAVDKSREHRGAIVLDVSVQPPKEVYQDGKVAGEIRVRPTGY